MPQGRRHPPAHGDVVSLGEPAVPVGVQVIEAVADLGGEQVVLGHVSSPV
jgi:hypothetical protein